MSDIVNTIKTGFNNAVSFVKNLPSSWETEAGTTQRDVVKIGVVSISVSFSVIPAWLKLLMEYKNQRKIPAIKGFGQ